MLDSPSLIKSVLTRFKSNRKIAEREDITNDINNNSNFTNNSDNKRERDKQQQQQLHKSLNPTSCENAQITPVILSQTSSTSTVTLDESTTTKVNNKSKEWSDKEKADLIKAVTKYPPGASNRWQRIGDLVATRTAADCIAMEKSMKTNFSPSNFSNLNAASWNQSSDIDFVKDAPTLAYATIEPVMLEEKRAAWTQEQQALFEKGLKQFGKETVNRWERISELVSGKNKEECIERFKTLCEALKKK
jgi:hypothetical protein